MQIFYHHLEYSCFPLTDNELGELINMTGIPVNLFDDFTTKKGTRVLTYTIPNSGGKESIGISIPQFATGTVKLRGSLFDYFPNFRIDTFRDFMKSVGGNPLRQDISFLDDQSCIDFAEYAWMSDISRYKEYLAGSATISRKKERKFDNKPDNNNRQGIPDVHSNHRWIQYGDASGNSAKLYVTADGRPKFEITIVDKKYGQALIDAYDPDTISKFEELAKQALVKSINFVTPESKRAKRPVQVESYRKFLGSDVKPIKWTDHVPLIDVAAETFDSGLSQIIARIQSLFGKHGILAPMIGDIVALEAKSRKLWAVEHEPLPVW